MTRWMRPPELERALRDRSFDPVVEGALHKLPPALSLAIWKRVVEDATDKEGRCDTEQARTRFRAAAVVLALHGGVDGRDPMSAG